MVNSEALPRQFGLKAMHGHSVYGRLVPNMVYTLLLRSTRELLIPAPKPPQGPANSPSTQ